MGLTISLLAIIPLLFLSLFSNSAYSIVYNDFPAASNSTLWTNNDSDLNQTYFSDGSILRFVIMNATNSAITLPGVGCGFFQNNETANKYYFVVFAMGVLDEDTRVLVESPQVLWTANRNKPVRLNATLQFTSMGDLVLKDVDGSLVWSTNTSGHSIVGMKINSTGNLVLHNATGGIIWQSFDYYTDTWVPGQRLTNGQRLLASVSSSNWSAGSFYVEFRDESLYAYDAYNESNPQLYATYKFAPLTTVKIEILGKTSDRFFLFDSLGSEKKFQYIRLDSDGHLRVYNFVLGVGKVVEEILGESTSDCDYPTVCGKYGICSNGKCSCPAGRTGNTSYFKPLNSTKPSLGCVPTTRVSCENLQLHNLVELKNVTYFNFVTAQTNVKIDNCKKACLKNCSCKAVLFRYYDGFSTGNCSLPNEIFSLKTSKQDNVSYNSKTFLKVQVTKRSNNSRTRILAATFSVFAVLVVVMMALSFVTFRYCKKDMKKSAENVKEEVSLDQVSETSKRFTFNDLKSATRNFDNRLGRGGFGSVFEGNLKDGTKIAVKRLDQLGQGRKEFLAEVKTIGSIHHVNLVRLVGYCVDKSHTLLVYEYMQNGSLDKWIFSDNKELTLDWQIRRKIILDIAKGLTYLHDQCRKKIVHLDIKPQNILLDSEFSAKVSDFGLATFIDRDQSQVLTAMRGTRGYMAPEWFSNRKITEKADVYSLGVVILEVMCGRKILDHSQPEDDGYLLHIVKRKAEEDKLFDVVDKQSEDMQQHTKEAVKMVRTAIWCLQSECSRRPSMSMVVKVLEDNMDMENISDYSFLTWIPVELPKDVETSDSAPQMPVILSGPR